MASLSVVVYFALDVASLLASSAIALFFFRSARMAPGRGLGILAGGFASNALGYIAVSSSAFRLLPGSDADDALRVVGLFLGALLLFTHYAGVRARVPVRARVALASFLAAGALAFFLWYALPIAATRRPPLDFLGAFRLAEALLLFAVAALVTIEVRARSLAEFRGPAAFFAFAFSRYTTAVVALTGVGSGVVALAYGWRLLALLLLLSLVPWRRGWRALAA